ncbi:MAG: AAA family ATPase [Desulfovibrio sp.]|jgi:ABC-type cobalamin/Fe3+-siderophores transport system ATPase subunit|nr:AAA family ATPase [Desulfovibrio sp.]
MLTNIYIDGFRHFKNFDLKLHPQTTLLSGLNGTGKTTIVEVMNRLQLFLVGSLPVTSLCNAADIPKWEFKEYRQSTSTLGIHLEVDGEDYAYVVGAKHNFQDSSCCINREMLKIGHKSIFSSAEGNASVVADDDRKFNYPVDWTFTGLKVAERNNSKIHEFIKIIKDSIFSVSINPFAISSSHQEHEPILNLDGSNFSAWYDYLLDKQTAVVADTFSEISSFIPGFKQFTFDKEGKNKELIADIFINKTQSYRLPFENLSHGQKLLCLLHLLIRVCPENSTILIDEFENFLSPVELQPLYDAAQDAFEERNIQFIFVSHHHKTMNWFQDSAIILSFSGNPSFVRVENFSPNDGISIDEHLTAKSGI